MADGARSAYKRFPAEKFWRGRNLVSPPLFMPDVTIKQYEARAGSRAGDPVPDVWDMLSVFILFLLAFDPFICDPGKKE